MLCLSMCLVTELVNFCSCHRRVDPAYERGATKFVREVAAASGGIDMIVCPCIDCRNIDRHCESVVVAHLVTRGM